MTAAVTNSKTVAAPAGSRPPWVLGPMLRLTDRMRANSRQVTVALVLLVPGLASTWFYATAVTSQSSFARNELAGVSVVQPAVAALTASVSGTDPDLTALTEAVGEHPELGLEEALAAVEAQGSDPAARAQALSALIVTAGDSSGLILDPDLDSFYVMDAQMVQLPKLLAATLGAPASDNPETPAQVRAVQAGLLTSTADAIDADVATAVGENSGLAPQLEGLLTTAEAARVVAADLLATDEEADTSEVTSAAASAVEPAAAALTELLDARASSLEQRRDLTLLLTATGFLIASWFGAATWWRGRNDVGLTLAAMSAIAAGDLDARPLPEGRDELGDIARSLEDTRRLLVGQRDDLAASFAEREHQLQTSFGTQRAAELQVRARAQGIIDETSTSVVAELNALNAQVENVRNTATEIEQRVATADEVTRGVIDDARAADQGAVNLGQSLRGVAGMAELITSVADQTKLLALNAAIEAARAGAAGRGFTVVAEEVKSLAATTAESAQEITATIAALEADAGQVGSAIGNVGSGITRLDEATASLRGVATDQFAIVARLDQALALTIDRVSSMATLTERLERRGAERQPAIGTANIEVRGRTHLASVDDLSLTGVRCTTTDDLVLRPGDEATITVKVDALSFRTAALAIRIADAPPGDLGLTFKGLDVASMAALRSMLAASSTA